MNETPVRGRGRRRRAARALRRHRRPGAPPPRRARRPRLPGGLRSRAREPLHDDPLHAAGRRAVDGRRPVLDRDAHGRRARGARPVRPGAGVGDRTLVGRPSRPPSRGRAPGAPLRRRLHRHAGSLRRRPRRVPGGAAARQLTDEQRARVDEIDAHYEDGDGHRGGARRADTDLLWPGYFFDRASAPPCPIAHRGVECALGDEPVDHRALRGRNAQEGPPQGRLPALFVARHRRPAAAPRRRSRPRSASPAPGLRGYPAAATIRGSSSPASSTGSSAASSPRSDRVR